MIIISCNKLFLAAAFVFIPAEPLFGEARILEIAQNSSSVQRNQSNFNWEHDTAQLKAFVPTNAAPQLSTSPRYDVLAQMELYFADGELSSGSHKRLWPLSTSDIIGFVLTILVLFIAAGGGIGGGGAIIPLYLLFLGFNTKVAVALGNITIVGGSLSNFVFNAPRRHSVFNRPLIDWDLILVMEPSTILGALIGGYINKVLPAWATTVLLAILLTFITYKLLVRGVITWKNESADKQSSDEQRQPLLTDEQQAVNHDEGPTQVIQTPERRRQSSHHEHHSPLAYTSSLSRVSRSSLPSRGLDRPSLQQVREPEVLTSRSEPGDVLLGGSEGDSESISGASPRASGARVEKAEAKNGEGEESERDHPEQENDQAALDAKQQELDDRFAEKRQIPPLRFGVMVLLTAVVAASDYFKGTVRCGTWLYWLLVLAIIPVVAVVTVVARSYLLQKRKTRAEAGYVWREGDVDWNPVTTLTYPAICSVAGLVAGMFGVGGGIVKMSFSYNTHVPMCQSNSGLMMTSQQMCASACKRLHLHTTMRVSRGS